VIENGTDVFRGGRGDRPPITQEFFAASIMWHQQWTATVAEQLPETATAALNSFTATSSFQTSNDCWPS